MGLLSSVGIGIGAAANAAQPFILNMQQAEIQKLRDDRMAEIAKGSADYASKLSLENEQTIYDRKLAREPEETSREIAKKGLLAASEANLEDQRRNDPAYLKGVAAEAAAKHIEPADRDAEGRKLRNDVAKLQLKNLQEDERIPKSVRDQAASLYKQADSLTISIANAELKGEATPEGVTSVQNKLEAINGRIGELLKPYRPTEAGGNLPPLDVSKYKVGGVDGASNGVKSAPTTGRPAQQNITLKDVQAELLAIDNAPMGKYPSESARMSRKEELRKLQSSMLGNK